MKAICFSEPCLGKRCIDRRSDDPLAYRHRSLSLAGNPRDGDGSVAVVLEESRRSSPQVRTAVEAMQEDNWLTRRGGQGRHHEQTQEDLCEEQPERDRQSRRSWFSALKEQR